ncbi:hypothetical protein Afil01_15750 [Actinorhabdospora filicis]|uniref:Uncharacterized protein n=1 Tax=Actinorhabdospora filicis TaxID=1785913 RepID=A0A9W6SIS2_9ACTN|nr:hypothetical protein [Actinorhabdospora filicis]GLZ76768.1 hypothetical protein Afil01_15750 [Actinorhabdospora filicis]
MSYRTATDASSRRRELDGGPSPFRAPAGPTDEAPPYEAFPETIIDETPYEAEPLVDPRLGPRRRQPGARRAQPRRVAQSRANSRSWLRILATITGIALLATCAAGTFFLLRDDRVIPPETVAPPPAASPSVDRLASRATDTEAVTVAEAFGAVAGYRVLKSDDLPDCRQAATGELAKLLDRYECSQVVRATLLREDGAFALTAGVVNLADAAGAQAVRAGVEEDAGDFTTLHDGGESAVLGRSATVVGYNTYGHYLLYAVIAPTDGKKADQNDPAYSAIVGEVVDTHLAGALHWRGE